MFRRFTLMLCSMILLLNSCGSGSAYGDQIKVYKSDDSIQCEGKGISLEVMAQELTGAGIEVICAQKGHDGLIRPAVCGFSTGNINVYQINRDDLSKAEDLGFAPVTQLPEYRDKECH